MDKIRMNEILFSIDNLKYSVATCDMIEHLCNLMNEFFKIYKQKNDNIFNTVVHFLNKICIKLYMTAEQSRHETTEVYSELNLSLSLKRLNFQYVKIKDYNDFKKEIKKIIVDWLDLLSRVFTKNKFLSFNEKEKICVNIESIKIDVKKEFNDDNDCRNYHIKKVTNCINEIPLNRDNIDGLIELCPTLFRYKSDNSNIDNLFNSLQMKKKL